MDAGFVVPMLRQVFLFAIFLVVPSVHAQDQQEFWPEVDTYVNLTSRTRLFFNDQLSSDQDTRDLQGEFGVNFDLFLRPFLRPKLRSLDPAKSKLLTWRTGYRYMPTLHGSAPSENRAITELTGRFKFPLAILFSDRNRLDFRWVENKPFSWRYRNRITLERNFTIHKYQFTPYIRAEFYWDSVYHKIDKNSFSVGSIFPLVKWSELEIYYEDQRSSAVPPNYHTRGVGLCLSLYF